jgi:hypothetical protein
MLLPSICQSRRDLIKLYRAVVKKNLSPLFKYCLAAGPSLKIAGNPRAGAAMPGEQQPSVNTSIDPSHNLPLDQSA